MKFNLPTLKYNSLAIVTIILGLVLLLSLGYIFFFKRISTNPELNRQKISFSIFKQRLENLPPELELFEILEPEEEDLAVANSEIEDDGRPIITIMLSELGTEKDQSLATLPAEINIGFIADAEDEEINDPAIAGRNVMLNIPLESEGYVSEDEDPQAMLLENSNEENLRRLALSLARLNNNQGVYTAADEKFTQSVKAAELLLANLKQKNLLYLCGKNDKKAVIYQLAEKIAFHILANDVILDEVISSEAINDKLIELEKTAKQQGHAIAMGSSYPLTVESLQKWLPSLEEKNIRIISIRDFYKITQQRKLKNIQ